MHIKIGTMYINPGLQPAPEILNKVEATLSLSIESLTNDDGEPGDNAK